MKIDIKKSIQYRFIGYVFKKKCLKNESLESLSQNDKDRICMESAQKTRKFTLIFIPFYIMAMLIFFIGFIMNPEYRKNDFVIWYQGILESVFPLISGDWGSAMYEKRATVILIAIKLIPVLMINGIPLLGLILIMGHRFLEKRIKDELFENDRLYN
ncbi:hypothetical protein [Bulleidia sp. zg-1006]|uniref:hypothetical protein n=1 Tax=Bulleidia sp. zg-1006 TaxID=2806552 RepID=UPI00193ACE42|nr:hypothetical protein [Bulleidia sp. zg-1006]QRG86947.1 hypothetical protein JOS54_01145 [Bulleidia sp. zg-1006]